MIIGQEDNLDMIRSWKSNNSFPRFIIITGEKGSGKKVLANEIAKSISGYPITPGNSVDSVREAIENAYKCITPTVYIFSDADKMSPQAKNALLKLTEEPPRSAYVIMTVQDSNNTLVTLKSRGTEINMQPYTYQELSQFTSNRDILDVAINPGQIKELETAGFENFKSFCESVVNNLSKVTGVNALKIGQKLKFKDDAEGYDPVLFFNCLMTMYRDRIYLTPSSKICHQLIACCSRYKNELRITGIKKDATLDMWIFEMREIYNGSEV